MKFFFTVLTSHLLTLSALSQINALPIPKKKMLGVYNTTTAAIMPTVKENNYPYYDIGYPYPIYGNEKRMGFSFRNTTGYRFFDALNLGAGVGFDNYESTAINLPLYGEISGNILNRRFTPIYYAQAGYGIGVNITEKDSQNRIKKAEGGVMAAAGIGFGGRLDQHTILRINFGYRLQKASYTSEIEQYNMPPYIMVRHMTYHRVELGLSFTFQQ